MKRRRSVITACLLSFAATLTSFSPVDAAVVTKKAGRITATRANTILSGRIAPSSVIGLDGDFYIDTVALAIYGPKSFGHWPAAVSLKGVPGAAGATGVAGIAGVSGAAGTEGKSASAISGVKGVQGERGVQGEKGLQGEKGEVGISGSIGPIGSPGPGGMGAAGAVGATGATGSTGLTGLTGPSGSTGASGNTGPAGIAGAKGDTGLQGVAGSVGATGLTGSSGSTGATGAVGATGIKGDTGSQGVAGSVGGTGLTGSSGSTGATGTVGATGPSQVQSIAVNSWTLQTATMGGSSSSAAFGILQPGLSYQFSIITSGRSNGNQNTGDQLGVKLQSSDSAAILSYETASSVTVSANPSNTQDTYAKYSFVIIGTIRVNTANSSLSLLVFDAGGDTSTRPLVFGGRALVQLIGAII